MTDSSQPQTENLGAIIIELLEERTNHSGEEWFRKQLSKLDSERRAQLQPLVSAALEGEDVTAVTDSMFGPLETTRSKSFDANWDPEFSGWSGRSKPAQSDMEEGFLRRFQWEFRDEIETWEIDVPGPLFKYYTERHRTRGFGMYIDDPFDRHFISSLADRVRSFGDRRGLDRRERINAAVRFVQSLEYTPDDVTTGQTEYPKYPIETLVHEGGDCEDTSILLGAILRELGCDVAPIVLPSQHHMILGVSTNFDISGAHYEYEGTRYYTLEATGHGWNIGDLPRQYRNASAQVYPLGDDPILVHEWYARPQGDGTVELSVHVANFGDSPAENLTILIEFQDKDNRALNRERLAHDSTLQPSLSERFSTIIKLPDDRQIRGRCILIESSRLHDESSSDWHGPGKQ